MAVWKSTVAALFAASVSVQAAAQAGTETSAAETMQEQVELTADNAYVLENENTVVAEGNVTVRYQDRVMTADSLTYNRDTGRVRARGNVKILEPDGTQRFADEIETSADLSDGYAVGFSMRTPEGETAAASSAIRRGDSYNQLDRTIFTACELCEGETTPTWAIRARRAVLNEETGMYSYRDAVFELAGIPVIYLPYFAHPDPKAKRRSGFLIPTVGSSSKTGLVYQQPYYWSISDYQDLVIAPIVYSKVNPLLEFDYRKRFFSGDVSANFSVTNERLFDSDGEKYDEKEWRGHLFADGKFMINRNWRWGFGIEETTDDLYTERYDIEGENDRRGLYTNQPRVLLSQLYTQGQSRNWYADGSVLTFDNLRLTGDSEDAIADVLPLAQAERDFELGKFGFASVGASAAFLQRGFGPDSQRLSASAEWSARKIVPGGVVFEPFANARYDYYDVADFPATGDSDTITRGLGSVGGKMSMPFYRPGRTVDILVEPIVMAAASTASPNDEPLPIEDSLYFELDTSTLFNANAQAGYDLYEGDQKIAAGISATARWKSGVALSGIVGRRWRSESDPAFDAASNLDGTVSDWLAGLSVDLNGPLSFDAQVRLDDDTLAVNRIDTALDLQTDRLRASAIYYQIDEAVSRSGRPQEGIMLYSEVSVTDNYLLLYELRREFEQQIDIRHSFGIGYQDDCSRFELIYERTERLNQELGPSESILFRFALATIGELGSRNFD